MKGFVMSKSCIATLVITVVLVLGMIIGVFKANELQRQAWKPALMNEQTTTDEMVLDKLKAKTLAEYNNIEKEVLSRIDHSLDSAIQSELKQLLEQIRQKKQDVVKAIEDEKRLFRELDEAQAALDKLFKPSCKGVKSRWPFD